MPGAIGSRVLAYHNSVTHSTYILHRHPQYNIPLISTVIDALGVTNISPETSVTLVNNITTHNAQCMPQNDSEGHYKCNNETGARQCLAGYEDPTTYCVTPVVSGTYTMYL